jgi:hypothetical protein
MNNIDTAFAQKAKLQAQQAQQAADYVPGLSLIHI